MTVSSQALAPGVFIVTDQQSGRSLLYVPLQGTVMEVNAAYVDRLQLALDGDDDAAKTLGLSRDEIDAFAASPPRLEHRLSPKWSDDFEPSSVTIFLTHRCTLRCTYCYCHGGQGLTIPWPILERAVRFTLDNAKKLGRCANIGVHGGDVGACWPLLVKSVAFIEGTADALGVELRMSIGTNGYYGDEKAAFIAAHFNEATLSIDGIPSVHDRYRPAPNNAPSLERVLRTAHIFDREGMSYAVRMTVPADAVDVLPESVEMICLRTSATRIKAEPLYNRGRAFDQSMDMPDPNHFTASFRKAQEVARHHGRDLCYSGSRVLGVFSSFCSFPTPTFGVTPEGNLTCCYEILHPGDPLSDPFFYGKISIDGSRIDVDPSRVRAIREWAADRRRACAECFCLFSCAGDCAAKVMDGELRDGELSRRCQITRSLVCGILESLLDGNPPHEVMPAAKRIDSTGPGCSCVDCTKGKTVEKDAKPSTN